MNNSLKFFNHYKKENSPLRRTLGIKDCKYIFKTCGLPLNNPTNSFENSEKTKVGGKTKYMLNFFNANIL